MTEKTVDERTSDLMKTGLRAQAGKWLDQTLSEMAWEAAHAAHCTYLDDMPELEIGLEYGRLYAETQDGTRLVEQTLHGADVLKASIALADPRSEFAIRLFNARAARIFELELET